MKLSLRVNPVLARESRVRMRGWRAPALISLYVGMLGLVVWIVVAIAKVSNQGFAPEMGGTIFGLLAFGQFALLVFSAPGLTAAAISGEREKQTLDLLLITRLSPLQVVVGKLGAAVSFSLLLMLASLPVYSLLFLLGGVSLYRLFLTVIVYMVTVLELGAIGIYFSSVFRRTQAAVVTAYGLTFSLLIVPMIASVLALEVFHRPPAPPAAWTPLMAYINPLFGLAAAAGGPFGEITQLYRRVMITNAAQQAIWWKYCLLALAITAGLVWLTARRIRPFKEQ